MSRASRKVKRFILLIVRHPGTPQFIKDYIVQEVKKTGTKEAAVDAQIAIVKNSTNTPAQRKAALDILLKAFREGI